ncbi:MAG TPA: GNAT family N-acetyltransferase [Candidatus Omnitrophica bacterium]|nr:GNAT family N-acetyltransferase [Candidatus Omnitrophota bacterium]
MAETLDSFSRERRYDGYRGCGQKDKREFGGDSMKGKISALKECEYEEFMHFMEESYSYTKDFFPLRYPHLYTRDRINWEHKLVIREDGRIVSHVGIFILPVEADGVNVNIGGIGGVATLPEYRDRGHMSELLLYSFEKMREEGCSISWLGGDRQRYRVFDYELVGRVVHFTVTERSLRRTLNPEQIRFVRYRGERELLERIISCHENEPLKVKRSRRQYELLMDRIGVITYVGENRGKSAYVTVEGLRSGEHVIEVGGDPLVLASLFMSLFNKGLYQSLTVLYPLYPTDIFSLLYKISSSWQIFPSCMIKILDIEEVLKAFIPQMEKRYEMNKLFPRLSFTLKMKDSNQQISIEIASKIKVGIREKGESIELCDSEMVSLLFGTFIPSIVLKKSSSILNTIFPLDFYVWPLDHV